MNHDHYMYWWYWYHGYILTVPTYTTINSCSIYHSYCSDRTTANRDDYDDDDRSLPHKFPHLCIMASIMTMKRLLLQLWLRKIFLSVTFLALISCTTTRTMLVNTRIVSKNTIRGLMNVVEEQGDSRSGI